MTPLIDSHCHLISHRYPESEFASLVERAASAGVGRMVATGTECENWEAYLELARRFPDHVYASLGIHPCDVHEAPSDWKERLETILCTHSLAALGETGLDYFHPAPDRWETDRFREIQKEFLRDHFQIASRHNLNVVIHTRDRTGSASFEDSLEIAREFEGKVRTMFHCFVGTRDHARKVLDIGGLLSFTGIVTFRNAPEVLDVARWCPDDSLLVETDAPYLAPEPFRGQRNEPAYVRETALFIARARGVDTEKFVKNMWNTAETFFNFRKTPLFS